MGGKAVMLACGAVVEFSESQAKYILENYPFVIEIKDFVPKHFRSDNYDEIRKFKEAEVLELSPEFHGVRINLKILWDKVRRYFYKKEEEIY